MINSKTIISALALSALAASAPTLGRSFSVSQVPINVSRVHPAVEYARVYIKHGVPIPHHVALAARTPHADSVVADPYLYDIVYLSPIKVGRDMLLVTFDTSTSDLWVKTKFSPSAGTRVYNQTSGTLLPFHHWQVRYPDTSILGGDVYKDVVRVGQVASFEQAVETLLYLHTPSSVFREVVDGVLGLAFSSLNTVQPTKQRTFYDNIKPMLSNPVFAACLKHNTPGFFDFGFIYHARHMTRIYYKLVDSSQGYWNITCDGFMIGRAASFNPFHAVVDTGSSLLLLRQSIIAQYYGNITSAYYSQEHAGWVFNCNDVIPSFSIILDLYNATIPGDYIKYVQLNGTLCYGGLQVSPSNDFGVLGAVFLKTQYVIFDSRPGKHPRVGFSKQRTSI
ncbi:hypothetical protein EYB25_002344 [Talaromyces marneffei]|nr:hypothetical protein EYB25_002344 [Talaromyces marneffei]